MEKSKSTFALFLLVLATLACNTLMPTAEPTATMTVIVEPTFPSQPFNLPATENDVPRVSLEEALAAHAAGAAVFVDVRSTNAFAASRIPDAVNIPLNEIELNPAAVKLDKEAWIITYCT
jgi:3-mercaptopyruvate sulfurtransferase SseA